MHNPETHRKILELHEQGTPKKRIAIDLGISRSTVQTIIRRYGSLQQFEAEDEQVNEVDVPLYREILTLWEQGTTRTDIETQTGASKYVVRMCIEQFRSLSQFERVLTSEGEITLTPKSVKIEGIVNSRRRYTDEELTEAVKKSRSLAETLRHLGVRAAGGNYATLKKRLEELDLDTTHFRGKGWLSGQKSTTVTKIPMNEILVKHSTYTHSNDLRKRLISEGYFPAQCACCNLTTWLDQPIPLEVDHINGDRRDNRLENLRLLCPNCHALTPTYRGKNISVD
jgi:hypothetical protein